MEVKAEDGSHYAFHLFWAFVIIQIPGSAALVMFVVVRVRGVKRVEIAGKVESLASE